MLTESTFLLLRMIKTLHLLKITGYVTVTVTVKLQ